MLIAQLSDLHIAGFGKKTYNVAPMAENLERCIAHINKLNPLPDLLIVTGDISKDGLSDETERAALILKKLKMPFFIVPGNHDNREQLWRYFPEESCPKECGDFMNYVINDYPIRLIGVDSMRLGESGGELCEVRATWLEQVLAEDKIKPTIIFMHHPPLNLGVIETDCDGFVGHERLGGILENYPNVKRLLCGHTHLETNALWRNILVTTAPSTGMNLVLDLTMEDDSKFFLEDPSYQLHYWTPEKRIVTYTQYVRGTSESYLFEDVEIES